MNYLLILSANYSIKHKLPKLSPTIPFRYTPRMAFDCLHQSSVGRIMSIYDHSSFGCFIFMSIDDHSSFRYSWFRLSSAVVQSRISTYFSSVDTVQSRISTYLSSVGIVQSLTLISYVSHNISIRHRHSIHGILVIRCTMLCPQAQQETKLKCQSSLL